LTCVEGEEKAYIGRYRSRTFSDIQHNEFEDAQWIANHGAAFPLDAARVLMPEDTIRFKERHHRL
jgi:hypothetical protein